MMLGIRTEAVPQSSVSRKIWDINSNISGLLTINSIASLLTGLAVAIYDRMVMRGPVIVTKHTFKYSSNVGVYPLAYHFPSIIEALPTSTHCTTHNQKKSYLYIIQTKLRNSL